jgi:hypothetical protein
VPKLKKKTKAMLWTAGGAAAAAWIVPTFRGGDSLIGLVWGSVMGYPLLGLAAGALTPSRGNASKAAAKATKAANATAHAALVPADVQASVQVGDWAVLARFYRQKAMDAAQSGDTNSASDLMKMATAAEARVT